MKTANLTRVRGAEAAYTALRENQPVLLRFYGVVSAT
jgi:hypothetical protein